jgi:hypothetical protein
MQFNALVANAVPVSGSATSAVFVPSSISDNGTGVSSTEPVYFPSFNRCADASGSGTAQLCNTAISVTIGTNSCFNYTTTTANTGAALTINVNSLGAKSVSWQGSTTLAANYIKVGIPHYLCYDGTNIDLDRTDVIPATLVTSAASLTSTALVTGAGTQGTQTPNTTTTLSAAGLFTTVAGTASAPVFQATGSASNTGIDLIATANCWTAAGTIVACLDNLGTAVSNTKAFLFSSTATANGTPDTGLDRLAAGVAEVDVGTQGASTGLLRTGDVCRITSAVTLSGTTAVICTWSLPAVAVTWAWQCMGQYSITAGTTPGFTLQMNASQAPTSETGLAQINITSATISGSSGGATQTSAGVQTILAGGSVGTTVANAEWTSSGTVQASATAGTFAIQAVLSGTGTPAGTVLVGSTCTLN